MIERKRESMRGEKREKEGKREKERERGGT